MDWLNVLINILTVVGLISIAGYMCSKWHADCCSFVCFFIFEVWLIVQGVFLVYASMEDNVILTGWDKDSSKAVDKLGSQADNAVEWQLVIGIGLIVISLGAIISVCIRRNNTQDVVHDTRQPKYNYDHYDRI